MIPFAIGLIVIIAIVVWLLSNSRKQAGGTDNPRQGDMR